METRAEDPRKVVTYSVEEGIATLSINRPERKNSLSVVTANRLHDLWDEVDGDPAVRVAILTSADCGTFCAGMDLKEGARLKKEQGVDILTLYKDPFHERMRRVSKPIIAAMTGHLAAGGTLLALNSDLRVGLEGTRLGITEAKVGRGSPWAVPLLWMMPQPLLMELVLAGEMLPIEGFRDIGFINYLEPSPNAVRTRARSLAATIRDNAPLSVAAGKMAILRAMSLGCDAGLEEAKRIYQTVYDSEDATEGPRAFSEKRKPVWKGR